MSADKDDSQKDQDKDENRRDQNGDQRNGSSTLEQALVDEETGFDAWADGDLDLDGRWQPWQAGIARLKIYHYLNCLDQKGSNFTSRWLRKMLIEERV